MTTMTQMDGGGRLAQGPEIRELLGATKQTNFRCTPEAAWQLEAIARFWRVDKSKSIRHMIQVCYEDVVEPELKRQARAKRASGSHGR